MPQLRALNMATSLDGFAAGPDQARDAPLGVRGTELHDWVFETRAGREMIGEPEPDDQGVDDTDSAFVRRGTEGIGATIMGRNMFGPVRGDWPDDSWTGWWGPNPPYHHEVFVLTHHARPSFEMEGGTTFHFVTDGIEAARRRAFASAGDRDVRLGGGVATVHEFMRVGLLDELHIPLVPVFLGRGERLLDNNDGAFDRYECVEQTAGERVLHIRFALR